MFMQKLNPRFIWLLSILLLAFFVGCSSDSGSGSQQSSSRIYELNAATGSLTAVAGDSGGTKFQLTFHNMKNEVNWFSDRPIREGGTDSINSLTNLWSTAYGSVAPNAVLEAFYGNRQYIQIFCTLEKPTYNEATGQLSFGMTINYAEDIDGKPITVTDLSLVDLELIIINNTLPIGAAQWSHILYGASLSFQAASAGTYTLRVTGPENNVYGYTSAPLLNWMKTPFRDYLNNWQAQFGDNPPNVAIMSTAANNAFRLQIATLSSPVYDENTNSITFTAQPIYGAINAGEVLSDVELFIDSSNELTFTIINHSGKKAYVRIIRETSPNAFENVFDNVLIDIGKPHDFKISNLNAGRVYISYDKPFEYKLPIQPDGANDKNADYNKRFDKVEFTYVNGKGKINLTAVDFYSIPMLLETSIKGTTIEHLTLANGMTGRKIEEALTALIAPADASSTIIKGGTGGVETLRILSPVKNPGAYPKFDTYLTTLIGAPLAISGTYFGKPAIAYSYATDSITAASIKLTEGKNTIEIPMSSLMWNATDKTNHNGIYTCNGAYTVAGAVNKTGHVGDNDIYSAVVRDVVTGFNLGYVKPKPDTNDSSKWWQIRPLPSRVPVIPMPRRLPVCIPAPTVFLLPTGTAIYSQTSAG